MDGITIRLNAEPRAKLECNFSTDLLRARFRKIESLFSAQNLCDCLFFQTLAAAFVVVAD